jgi:hypothetical protein
MIKYVNGEYIEMTAEEIAEMQAQEEQAQAEYWATVDYGDAINTEIRKRYTASEEFSILRQRDEKQEEFAEYYKYCEECKAIVKQHLVEAEKQG